MFALKKKQEQGIKDWDLKIPFSFQLDIKLQGNLNTLNDFSNILPLKNPHTSKCAKNVEGSGKMDFSSF